MRIRLRSVWALVAAVGLAAAAVGCRESRGHDEPSEGAGPKGRVFVYGYPNPEGRHAVTGVSLYTVDLPAGQPERVHLPELGLGDPLEFIDVTGGRLVFYGAGGATYSVGLDLAGDPRLLGKSWYFVPSATDGRAWLTYLDPHSPATVRDLSGTREVTVDGRITVEAGSTRPPCSGPTVVAAVRRALLCQDGHEMVAFDPSTGEELRRVPGAFPLASGRDLVASCDEPCPRLRISDPVAGEGWLLDPDPRFEWDAGYDGAFTRDGSLLAVPVKPTSPLDGASRNARLLALVDVANRSVEVIDGGGAFVGGPMTFSSSGDWLFFTSSDGALMAYQPGASAAREVARIDGVVVLDLAAS